MRMTDLKFGVRCLGTRQELRSRGNGCWRGHWQGGPDADNADDDSRKRVTVFCSIFHPMVP